jgi:cellulose synthase/poly-beta-1,6-N-acetylglucosamine synthase-like glycosyltransferase
MEIVFDVFNYVLVALMIGVSGAWIALICSMIVTFQKSPFLDKFKATQHNNPKVSVILPARNEENFIKKCLDSLLSQDYNNYEIMAIDDSSEDSTGKIIEEYSIPYLTPRNDPTSNGSSLELPQPHRSSKHPSHWYAHYA